MIMTATIPQATATHRHTQRRLPSTRYVDTTNVAMPSANTAPPNSLLRFLRFSISITLTLTIVRLRLRMIASFVNHYTSGQFWTTSRLLVTYRISVSALAIMHSPRSADPDGGEAAVYSQIHPIHVARIV